MEEISIEKPILKRRIVLDNQVTEHIKSLKNHIIVLKDANDIPDDVVCVCQSDPKDGLKPGKVELTWGHTLKRNSIGCGYLSKSQLLNIGYTNNLDLIVEKDKCIMTETYLLPTAFRRLRSSATFSHLLPQSPRQTR